MPCIVDSELCQILARRSPLARVGRIDPAETLDTPILTTSGFLCLAIGIGGIAWT